MKDEKVFDAKPVMDPEDISNNRLWAAVGYLGILCLVPLLLKTDSPYALHHGKQGLVLLIAWIVFSFVNIIPILGQIVWFVASLGYCALVVVGMIKAMQGETWEVPYIGHYAHKIDIKK